MGGTVGHQPAIPHAIDDVDAAWLTDVLGRPVADLAVEPIGVGIGVMALLHRVTPTYTDEPGPPSVVLKLASLHEPVRQIARGYHFYEREVGVYQHLAPQLTIGSPACHFAAHDADSDDFVLVLEDLSDHRVCDQVAGASAEDATLVVDELAKLHTQWFANERLADYPFIQRPCDPPYPQFQAQSTKADWPVFVERFGDRLPSAMRAVGERWYETGPAIMEHSRHQRWTLVHGDVRLDNIFFDDAAGTLRIVDWQIAYQNSPSFDLAYFLCQSLSVENRRALEPELLRRYHDALTASGIDSYSYEEFFEDYRRSVLFSFCYPLSGGANADLVNDRVVDLVNAMIDRSISAIEDLDALELLPA
jgi:thiamine kinase-like enzyme